MPVVNSIIIIEWNRTYKNSVITKWKYIDSNTEWRKNGVINNTTDPQINMDNAPASLEVGDIISQLPEGSKVVTINGEQLYETPDNVYLQEVTSNGPVEYKVVGK